MTMTIALSRTGLSPTRMQFAAQALLASDGDNSQALEHAASVCQLRRDSDQIAHALGFIRDSGQAVTLITTQLDRSIRLPLLVVDRWPDQIRIRLDVKAAPAWIATSQSLILSGRFLGRPLVCALEPVGLSDPGEFRIAKPAWMLLADQRDAHRVKPPDCRVATSWGEVAPVLDLSESGVAIALAGPPPLPVREGSGWSGLLMNADMKASIPVCLTTVHAVPQGVAGLRIGARFNVSGRGARSRLKNLIGRHIDLFGEF